MEILAGSLLTPDTVNPTDYPIAETDINLITKRGWKSHIQLDQLDLSPHGNVSCFYCSAFKIVADAYELTPEEKVRAYQAYKDGWAAIVKDGKVIPGFGGRLSDGIDYARRAWNAAFPDKKVKTYRGIMPRFDQDSNLHLHFYRAMNNGWMVQFGGYVDSTTEEDLLDGVLNNDTVGEKKYGHARNLHSYSPVGMGGGIGRVFDNYAKSNKVWGSYLIDDIETKVANQAIFPSYFLALPA
jgi:hypothetical protein